MYNIAKTQREISTLQNCQRQLLSYREQMFPEDHGLTEKDKNQGLRANGHRRCEAATTESGTMTSIEWILYPTGKDGRVVAIMAPCSCD